MSEKNDEGTRPVESHVGLPKYGRGKFLARMAALFAGASILGGSDRQIARSNNNLYNKDNTMSENGGNKPNRPESVIGPLGRKGGLHEDLTIGRIDQGIPEYERYDPDTSTLIRYPDVGPNGERSVVHRISQFGITPEVLRAAGVEDPTKMTEEQYSPIIKEALLRQYEVIFANVFHHWNDVALPKQLPFIKHISGFYEDWGLRLVKKGELVVPGEPNMVIALEGASVIDRMEVADKLIEDGIGSINPQYNDANSIATVEGLTSLGEEVIPHLFKNGVIVDLAHAKPGVRANIMRIAENGGWGRLLAYTHGSLVEDIEKDPQFGKGPTPLNRGITREEARRIADMGGIIGLCLTRPFFESVGHIAERIDDLLQLENGPRSLGIGTDFGGVPKAWEVGISNLDDMVYLANELATRFGVSGGQIRDIFRNNATNWVSEKPVA